MIRLSDGQVARRPWSEITIGAAFLVALIGAVVASVFALHPSGVGRIALPVLLAVASIHVGVTLRRLVFLWRHVLIAVPQQTKPWPAAEDLDDSGRGGVR